MCEDSADAGGRGGPGGKKEASSSKTVADGKLVKGTLLPVLALRGSFKFRERCLWPQGRGVTAVRWS